MFDVFWAISSDNGLKKKKHSGLVELREAVQKNDQSQLLFSVCLVAACCSSFAYVNLVTSYSSRSFH